MTIRPNVSIMMSEEEFKALEKAREVLREMYMIADGDMSIMGQFCAPEDLETLIEQINTGLDSILEASVY